MRAEVKALEDKLAANGFPTWRPGSTGLNPMGEERAAMEERLGGRIERIGQRMEQMEGRLLDAIRGRAPEAEAAPTPKAPEAPK